MTTGGVSRIQRRKRLSGKHPTVNTVPSVRGSVSPSVSELVCDRSSQFFFLACPTMPTTHAPLPTHRERSQGANFDLRDACYFISEPIKSIYSNSAVNPYRGDLAAASSKSYERFYPSNPPSNLYSTYSGARRFQRACLDAPWSRSRGR